MRSLPKDASYQPSAVVRNEMLLAAMTVCKMPDLTGLKVDLAHCYDCW